MSIEEETENIIKSIDEPEVTEEKVIEKTEEEFLTASETEIEDKYLEAYGEEE